MPRLRPDQITRGMRLEGATYPADDPRKARIVKGRFMTVDNVATKRAPLPADLAEFQSAASFADQLKVFDHTHRDGIAEIARRLQAIREQLDKVKRR